MKAVSSCSLILFGSSFAVSIQASNVNQVVAQTSGHQAETSIDTPTEVEKIRVIGARDSGLELSSKKILKVPGAGNDPIRAVESLPGVVLANGFAPAVRGSSPNDMYYQSDGVPIGKVFHIDSVSTFHPNLIQSFELKTGAFEAEFSDSIGGVIDTTLREPELRELTTTLDLSFLRAGVLIESQLTEYSAFYLAFRQSLIHLYIEDLIGDEEEFKFQQAPINDDYQFKYLNNIDENNKLVVQATGSNDDVRLLFSDDATEVLQNPDLKGTIGFNQYYHNQSVVWTNFSGLGETIVTVGRLEQSNDLVIGQILDLDATSIDYLFKLENLQLLDSGELHLGAELREQDVDYQVTGKTQPCNEEFEVCPPSYYSSVAFEQSNLNIKFSTLFAQYDWDIFADWILKLGATYDRNDYTGESFLEPRVAVKWQFADDYRLKLAYGQHHQWFRQYKYLSETFGAPSLSLPQAEHYVLGLEFEGESDWAWRVETYYKDMDELVVSNPATQTTSLLQNIPVNSSQEYYLNEGEGTAYGVEILINKAISNSWYGWLSVAYSKTERVNKITNEDFNYEYDLPWIVNLVGNYEIDQKWQLGLRWRFQSGALYTPVLDAEPVYPLDNNGTPDSSQQPIFYDPIEGGFNSERFENFHRMDVRLDYQTLWWGKETNVYFEVLNLYGKKSIEDYDYNEDYSEREPSYQFPESPIPSIGVQIIF